MIVLGVNYFFHDSSACLVIDGKIAVMLEEERFTRNKHTSEFPNQSIDRCLKLAGISYSDIDHIALSIKPTKDWWRKVLYGLKNLPHLKPFVKHELWLGWYKQKEFTSWYRRSFGKLSKKPELHWVPHHLAHSAGTFLASPYESAAILSLDGSGEWATSYLGRGKGIDVECIDESFFPMSLGAFYEAATEFCGFRPNHDEGKTMGLAPFGDPRVFAREVGEIARVEDRSRIRIDLSCFEYQYWGDTRCGERFFKIFGKPRGRNDPFSDNHHNVAAAFQFVLEECALEMSKYLREKTKERNLIIAGGVALNSVMNGRILRESGFDDIYVMPAAGDNGTSIGAALHVYHSVFRKERTSVHDDPYLGTSYSNDEIKQTLKACKLDGVFHSDIASHTAQLLADGAIIGWFQGRMEIGPRALGNRSILANPAFPEMKNKINAEVKHREAYRPFAPSIPVEEKDRYFQIKGESPFMLKVCPVLSEKRDIIPAVTHVDGTARVQTIEKRINPLYHDLLTKFGNLTGVPVLLNTSFNIQGEPIIESPLQAIRCFFSTGLDHLVMGNYVVSKNGKL